MNGSQQLSTRLSIPPQLIYHPRRALPTNTCTRARRWGKRLWNKRGILETLPLEDSSIYARVPVLDRDVTRDLFKSSHIFKYLEGMEPPTQFSMWVALPHRLSTIHMDPIISLLHFLPACCVFLLPKSLHEVNFSPCGHFSSQQTCIQITHICSVVRVVKRPTRPWVHIMEVLLLKPFVKGFTPGKRQLHRTLNERGWPCDVSCWWLHVGPRFA